MDNPENTPETNVESIPTTNEVEGASNIENRYIAETKMIYDPSNPPSEEMDCFGKYHSSSDPICMGDPNDPTSPPCLVQEDCRLRTLARLRSIDNTLNRGNSTNAKVSNSTRADSERLLNELPQFEGVELKPHNNPKFLSYYHNGKEIAETHVMRTTQLSFSAAFEFEGGYSVGGGWYRNHPKGKGGDIPQYEEFLPKIQGIIQKYLDSL